jgi:hypothetical protein
MRPLVLGSSSQKAWTANRPPTSQPPLQMPWKSFTGSSVASIDVSDATRVAGRRPPVSSLDFDGRSRRKPALSIQDSAKFLSRFHQTCKVHDSSLATYKLMILTANQVVRRGRGDRRGSTLLSDSFACKCWPGFVATSAVRVEFDGSIDSGGYAARSWVWLVVDGLGRQSLGQTSVAGSLECLA